MRHLQRALAAGIGTVALVGGLLGGVAAAAPAAGAPTVTKTFSFTGSVQHFTVPPAVTRVTVAALGAQGGASHEGGGSNFSVVGAKGGMATATIAVTPGQVLAVNVGGQPAPGDPADGGFNGGGKSGRGGSRMGMHGGAGGGGGGASDVRQGGSCLGCRGVVAGGGGGGGGDAAGVCSGGAGGGVTGDPGSTCNHFEGGGGTQQKGGSAGLDATPGTAGFGGSGGSDPSFTVFGGAGGGGGWFGGGGAGGGDGSRFGGGGGGGSGFVPASDPGAKMKNGVREGNGQVMITYEGPKPPTLAELFGAREIPFGGSTKIVFALFNPNDEVPLTGVAFTDPLPNGLVVATPSNGVVGTCGTIAANPASSSISVSGVTLAKHSSCSFSVDVIGTTPGVHVVNETSAITSKESATETGKPASDSIERAGVHAERTCRTAQPAPAHGTDRQGHHHRRLLRELPRLRYVLAGKGERVRPGGAVRGGHGRGGPRHRPHHGRSERGSVQQIQ